MNPNPGAFPWETEKKLLNKDSHKVIGHNCKWFSIWLCSGGKGGGVVLLYLVTGQGEEARPVF